MMVMMCERRARLGRGAGLILASALALGAMTRGASAQQAPEVATSYKSAQRLVDVDARQALTAARALPKLPHADDMRLRLLADAALHAGEVVEAVALLERYASATPDGAEAFRARLDRAELLVLLDEGDQAEALLARLDRERGRLKVRFNARRHLFARVIRMRHDLAKGAGRDTQAKQLARSLLISLPSEEPTRRPGLALEPDALSRADLIKRARMLYQTWSYREARALYEQFKDDPTHGDEARWHLAEIALNKLRDDFKGAEPLYDSVIKHPRYGPEALYQKARSQMRQERYADCLKTMDRYLSEHPKGPHVELIRYYQGWLPYDRRDHEGAIKGLTAYLDRYGRRGARSSYIYGFLAWTYMRMGRWQDAIDTFEAMMPYGNPVVAGKALYWQAHAWHQLKDNKRAIERLDLLRKRYPVSYYGVLGEQLRATIQGDDARASKVWWPEGSGTYDPAPRVRMSELPEDRLSASTRARWERVKALVALGEDQNAREALSPIRAQLLSAVPAKDRRVWLHALGSYVHDYNTMWREATGGTISVLTPLPDDDPLRSVMAYPQAYPHIVGEVAQEFALPPYLIWAIMRQESRYKPGAISHTDAVGALQMIPETARKVAHDLDIVYNPRTFHFPEVGFRYSAYYMRKLLDTFGHMFTPMATSYNSGPRVVVRWFKRNPDAPFPWLIEEFEYNEGRNYGRKVTEHMVRYVYLYERDEATRAKLLDQMFPLSREVTLPDDPGY